MHDKWKGGCFLAVKEALINVEVFVSIEEAFSCAWGNSAISSRGNDVEMFWYDFEAFKCRVLFRSSSFFFKQ